MAKQRLMISDVLANIENAFKVARLADVHGNFEPHDWGLVKDFLEQYREDNADFVAALKGCHQITEAKSLKEAKRIANDVASLARPVV